MRAAGLPRRALRLRNVDEALRETATEILRPVLPAARLDLKVHNLVARADEGRDGPQAHRALADAIAEHGKWLRVRQAARELATSAG